nr:PREDICTED: Golgi-specific brefeldin A-resistance guanine nucleotide exchange factor 1 [Bemisia tabaci]
MSLPGNGIYIVLGEVSTLLTAMKRGNRWSSHSQQDKKTEALIKNFNNLKDSLNQVGDLELVSPSSYLGPFLQTIKSDQGASVSGAVTSLAISSINKFLSYELIGKKTSPQTIEKIADAVTHARFVGTDEVNDAVVLMKILQVLRTLMVSPAGTMLSDEKVCEIMFSCFKICFETRLSDLLRRCAEHFLKDMVQLVFMRLPYLDSYVIPTSKKLELRSSSTDNTRSRRKYLGSKSKTSQNEGSSHDTPKPSGSAETTSEGKPESHLATTPQAEQSGSIVDMQGAIHDRAPGTDQLNSAPDVNPSTENMQASIECTDSSHSVNPTQFNQNDVKIDIMEEHLDDQTKEEDGFVKIDANNENIYGASMEENDFSNPEPTPSKAEAESKDEEKALEYVNTQGVRFKTQDPILDSLEAGLESKGTEIIPYGLGCVIELLRFLVSLCNSYDKQNTEIMTFTSLSLLTVALELGADPMSKHPALLALIKDSMCRNFFSLLNTERISLLAADLRCCFLLFESQRSHLKFQLEVYLSRLAELISSEKSSYEVRELALEALVQLWRVPGLITELYLNYDCDLYCPNLYEDLTKLLSKNVFPVTGIHSTNLLALDALLAVTDSIESHCHSRISNNIAQSDSTDSLVSSKKSSPPQSAQKYPSQSPNSIFMRIKVSDSIPSHEQLMAVKRKKKLLASGTDHFNAKPKKGIEFLQEQGLLSSPLDPIEVVHFLKENPHLSKKMIGEFISNRANLAVLDAFVKSFDFSDTQIDEALRMYLETFRLPGESPLISLVMEQFADHWHKCNGEPFVNSDAAFTLAYAVIMLNVDQHNYNVKRQNNPMTPEEFKRNLSKVNGGQDFDQDMLDDIYQSIKNEEIVMPAEHTGLVRENYLWKVLLRRGNSKDGTYIRAPDGMFDHDLFSLIWGPIVAALGFVFDKSSDPNIYMKAMIGFRKCATISAHYGMSNEFDNLTVSLCKFSTLLSTVSNYDSLTVAFGENHKARVATKTMFNLIHRHGDTLREGWKSVLECILQLYRCNLLPKILVEAEDFIDLSGKISLVREETPLNTKTESGLLSSLYSYIALAAETGNQRTGTAEDEEAIQIARDCIHECHLEQLITESKFLRIDSMQQLVIALIQTSYSPEGVIALGTPQNEDKAVFFLEFMLKIVIQNRDRVTVVWENVRDHIYTLLMGAAACDHHFLVERSVVALLRLSIRLMRREEMSPVVVQSLRMLLLLKSSVLNRVVCQISYGLYELLKTSAANIHSAADWTIIFTLLECVGAGMPPPKVIGKTYSQEISGTKSDGEISSVAGEEDSGLGNERGYTSDSELSRLTPSPTSTLSESKSLGGILVSREGEAEPLSVRPFTQTKFSLPSDQELQLHDPFALVKCCESLAFLVRDVAHITPYNFERCISCIRTFVEASLITIDKKSLRKTVNESKAAPAKPKRKLLLKKKNEESGKTKTPSNPYDGDESDSEDLPSGYHQVPIQLLDLMHTLHTRTAQIHRWWAEENSDAQLTSLWAQGWCPLLQGIARLCCDSRKQVRMSAMTYLQRALLVHDLQALTADEWAACFNQVLFPLMTRLLIPPDLDETRMRAATLLSKVFLHHLTPLQSLPSFLNIWLTILDLMGKYMVVHNSDLLSEAIPESLKNMLLVMDSAKVFSQGEQRTALWDITWNRINAFLPNLKEELFKSPEAPPPPPPPVNPTSFQHPSPAPPQVPMSLPLQLPETIQSPQVLLSPQTSHIPQTVQMPQPLQVPPNLFTPQMFPTSQTPQNLPVQSLPLQALQFSQPLQISQTLQLPQTPLAPHTPQSPTSEIQTPPLSSAGTPHSYSNI